IDIKKIKDIDYYVLIPVCDDSLKIMCQMDNKFNFIRPLITKDEVNNIIKNIKNIEEIKSCNRNIDNTYIELFKSNRHEDLIKIIKTTYLRNKERLDNNKKISDIDDKYFNMAEKYL
ncbi:MAG: hypothetical protein IJZ36_01350, partial [Bacilli bacterium]|nr:hypothetical protein [Bacilli bacterium]